MKSQIKILLVAAVGAFLVEAVAFYFTSNNNDSSLTVKKINSTAKRDTSVIADTSSHVKPIQKPKVSETSRFDLILTFFLNVETDVHNLSHKDMSEKYSTDLKGYGFSYKGWIHDVKDLADHYGSFVYCKKCGVNNTGTPSGMKDGSFMIKFSSYGYGPCVTFFTLDKEIYDNLKKQFLNEGYSMDSSEESGNQLVKSGNEEDTFITFYKRLNIYSIQVWRYPKE